MRVAYRHAIEFCRHFSGNRRRIRFFGGKSGRFAVAADHDDVGMRQVFRQPAAALRQRLAVRIDAADVRQHGGVSHEVLPDAQ